MAAALRTAVLAARGGGWHLISAAGTCRRRMSTRCFVGAIDQGTSSTRFILYDASGAEPVPVPGASCQVELADATTTPRAGWAQMDPIALLASVETCAAGALERGGVSPAEIAGVGITNQRESTVVWDRTTGVPLCDAILWLDTRTRDTVAALEEELGGQDTLRERCGLPVSTYFSGVKLRWLLDNNPSVAAAISDGSAKVGTVDSFLTWHLTKGDRHVTDVTNASRTMMMNLASCEWDEACLGALGVSAARDALPDIVPSAGDLGTIATGSLSGIKITGIVGDQQSAMLGQRCTLPGMAKSTYGTGAFVLLNTGTSPVPSSHGLLSTALYKLGPDVETVYALEGAVASCAVGINWFRDSLGMIADAPEIDQLAEEAAAKGGTQGLYFVSAFGGLLAPHWRDDARGTLVGLTLAHDRSHIALAVLEGIGFQVADVIDAMVLDSSTPLAELRVDGGVSRSDMMLKRQADLLGAPVSRPANVETTALGAAIAAGIGAGVWDDVPDGGTASRGDLRFEPSISVDARAARRESWNAAVASSLGWADRA